MNSNVIKVSAAALIISLFTANQAFALCLLGLGDCGGGGGGTAVPEVDGPAGIAAIALLASVVAVVYNRMKSEE